MANLIISRHYGHKSLFMHVLKISHWVDALHRVGVRRSQLCVHGDDIEHVHGVGARQEGGVGLQDEVMVLRPRWASVRQAQFVPQ